MTNQAVIDGLADTPTTVSVTATQDTTGSRLASITTAFLAAFVVWLPLQTPIAVVLYQYAGVSVDVARAVLLLKDVAVATAIVVLIFAIGRTLRIRWFDIAAIGYVIVVGVYSVLPIALGTELPLIAIVASAREFIVPVELYFLGRLAIAAGVDLSFMIKVLLGSAAVAAAATVLLYFLPPEFWNSTMDLVRFERDVQGISNAVSLWDIGLLGQFGVGIGGQFSRAIGPFTHPVGTAHYFVMPLVIAAAGAMHFWNEQRRAEARPYLLLVALFAAAVITPISRGSWFAAAIALMLLALLYRRIRITFAVLAIVGLFIALVPPFSYSITSALSRTDSSVKGHELAIERGTQVVVDNPFGLGLGQADHFGKALSNEGGVGPSAGVGENLYLALLVSVGPVGFLLFLAWCAGLLRSLLRAHDSALGWIGLAVACSAVGYLSSAMTASALMRFTTSATFWLYVGLAVGVLATRPTMMPLVHWVRRSLEPTPGSDA